MRYWIEVYDDDDLRKVVEFETDKELKDDNISVCGKLTTYMEPEATELVIPEGVTTLADEVFWNSDLDLEDILAKKLVIPAGLKEIENNAFLMGSFREIIIDSGNTSFMVKDGGLYTADGKRLIYILVTDEERAFRVPEGTEIIDGSALYFWGKIHIPASVTEIGEAMFYDCTHIVASEGSYAIEFAEENGIEYELEE